MLERLELVMHRVIVWLATVRQAERGQGLVEYAAILGFVAACMVVAELFLQPAISKALNDVTNSF